MTDPRVTLLCTALQCVMSWTRPVHSFSVVAIYIVFCFYPSVTVSGLLAWALLGMCVAVAQGCLEEEGPWGSPVLFFNKRSLRRSMWGCLGASGGSFFPAVCAEGHCGARTVELLS